jgi:methionine sulfoxide reductase heme-binding subunit
MRIKSPRCTREWTSKRISDHMKNRFNGKWWSKTCMFFLCLLPFVFLLAKAALGDLSPNPVSDITQETGVWTLRFLLATLCVTPFRKLIHWKELITFRRMLGLFAFFYGSLHLMTYVSLDQSFSVSAIIEDVAKRPFITAGTTGFVLMIPLAITSTRKWIARLGGKRWQALHRLVYVSSLAGVVHYLWLVKADIARPVRYSVLLAVLLSYRLLVTMQNRWVVQKLERGPMLTLSQSND